MVAPQWVYFTVVSNPYTSRMKFRDINPLNVRFPTELKEQIEKSAAKNRRSMNAEILAAMQAHYEGVHTLKDASDGQLIDELIRRWGRNAVYIRLGKDGETK